MMLGGLTRIVMKAIYVIDVYSLEEMNRFEFDVLIIASLNKEFISNLKHEHVKHAKKMIYPRKLKEHASKIFNELIS